MGVDHGWLLSKTCRQVEEHEASHGSIGSNPLLLPSEQETQSEAVAVGRGWQLGNSSIGLQFDCKISFACFDL